MEGSGRGLRSDVVLKSICNDGDERRKAQNSRCVDGDLNPTLPLEPTCSVSVLLFVFFVGNIRPVSESALTNTSQAPFVT